MIIWKLDVNVDLDKSRVQGNNSIGRGRKKKVVSKEWAVPRLVKEQAK